MKLEPTEKGSALLVSLMVMVGLSLLGLGFVAISETESAISVNERNYTQTLQIAEAGAKTVVEWFQRPEWALANKLMPANTAAIKQERSAIFGSLNATYTGSYKPTLSKLLFDLPLKGAPENRFFGVDAQSADIVINKTTAAAFLDDFNTTLFNDNAEGGRVVEIRIYAPPIMDALAGNEKTEHPGGSKKFFWNKGTRYGVATIEVTAEKRRNPADDTSPLIARRTVRVVVSEFPLPGPEGPLQSNQGIETNGSFRVHWGKIVSLGNLALKREMVSIPWANAWDMTKWEHGYDPIYDVIDTSTSQNWFWDLLNKGYEDPWFQARARFDITTDGGSTAYQPYPYSSINDVENNAGPGGWSNQFQQQNEDKPDGQREVIFPRVDYNFWKQIAISGQGQEGIYYLQYDKANDMFYDSKGTKKTFGHWVNTNPAIGGKEGFFFFDTDGSVNPQLAGGLTDTSVLTKDILINNADGNPFVMRGFIYLNALSFGSKGLKGDPGYYAAPGEPFRDVGFWEVDPATNLFKKDGAGKNIKVNYTNYQWDYQDVNGNGKFDLCLKEQAVTSPPAGTDTPASTQWVPVPFFEGCTVYGQNGLAIPAANQCSEPHEPYLNLIYPYPDACCAGAAQPNAHVVLWQHPLTANAQTRRPKVYKADGKTPVDCSDASTIEDCTSNIYDKDGGLMTIDKTDGINLDGVLYNEGKYYAQGNAIYYGSVLARGAVTGTSGTADVWFDERLVKGDWQRRFKQMPRVVITSHETDN